MGVPTATRGHPARWVRTQGRRGCRTAFSRNRPTFRWNENDARVRIGVCSDVHGRHDRLLAVLAAMAAAGVDERWCLGDLVGREPVTAELVGHAVYGRSWSSDRILCVERRTGMPPPQREPLRAITVAEQVALERMVSADTERVDQVRRAAAVLAV